MISPPNERLVAIIGGTVGGVGLVVFVAIIVVLLVVRRRKATAPSNETRSSSAANLMKNNDVDRMRSKDSLTFLTVKDIAIINTEEKPSKNSSLQSSANNVDSEPNNIGTGNFGEVSKGVKKKLF